MDMDDLSHSSHTSLFTFIEYINITTVWTGIVHGMTWQGLAMVTVGWGGAGEGRGTTKSGVSYRCWWCGIGELKSNLVDKEIICGWPWWTQLQIYTNNTYCGAIYLLSTEKMNIENTIVICKCVWQFLWSVNPNVVSSIKNVPARRLDWT